MHTTVSMAFKLAVFALLAAVPLLGESFYTELLAKTLVLAIFAMSLDLLVGFTGLVSFGHAAYFGVAAYAAALLSPEYEAANLWLVFPAAVGAAMLVAFVVGLFVLRTKGIYFIMVTLAFAQLAYFVFHDTALGGGSDGIYLNLNYFALAMLVLVYVFLARILQSPFGRVLVGIKSNEHRMQSLGYITFRYKLAAFALAGGLAGVAGFLYAVLFGFVTPELLSWHHSGNVLLTVILGGMGNLLGAVAGAFAFTAMQEVFGSWTKHWQLLMGCVIVAAVLFLPGGLSAIPGRIKRTLQGDSIHD